jgi:hypothetical protein
MSRPQPRVSANGRECKERSRLSARATSWRAALDRSEARHHRSVAIDPRLALNDPVEMLKKARVASDRGIEIDVLHVGEDRGGWIGRLRERIDFHLLAVGDGGLHIRVAMALEVRAEQHIAAERVRLQGDKPSGTVSL